MIELVQNKLSTSFLSLTIYVRGILVFAKVAVLRKVCLINFLHSFLHLSATQSKSNNPQLKAGTLSLIRYLYLIGLLIQNL